MLAALQRLGRRPPPALLVSPEDALQSVRAAILLGAVLPDMKVEVDTLVADLAELVRVRSEIAAEREVLGRDLAALSQERTRMTVLVQERQRKQTETEKALEAERARAVQLARQADNLKDLIGQDRAGDRLVGARRSRRAGRNRAAADPKNSLAALKDPGRLSPAIAFASAKGALPLPISGIKIREFGVPDGLGGTEKGLSVASRAGAQVTAPCDGWVVYAGPFRSYGQLLILNAGGGYHVLLAGMERISVDLGQFVLTGEPVAVMGGGPQSAAAIATGSSQPVLYIEFRKDGVPRRSQPVVGGKRQRKGSRMIRKTSLILLGAAAGVAATLLVTQPRLILSAKAAAADTYRQLNLFGDVFERVRADYVEKPDDTKLIEQAINGMLNGLDPHSSYMDPKSFRDMQVQTRGEFGGLGIEVTMEDGLVKVVAPIDDTPGRQGRRPWPTTSSPISTTSRCRA